MLINYSNHPSENWSEKQRNEAELLYGAIVDFSFPGVPVSYTTEDITVMAKNQADQLMAVCKRYTGEKNAVMCQGEFTLCFAVCSLLQSSGIEVVVAVTERKTVEKIEDSKTIKISQFEFAGFRAYPNLKSM
jgi:hypothetical protein